MGVDLIGDFVLSTSWQRSFRKCKYKHNLKLNSFLHSIFNSLSKAAENVLRDESSTMRLIFIFSFCIIYKK